MTGSIFVFDPGSVRFVVDPVSGVGSRGVWGTLDEQIAEATAANLVSSSKTRHKSIDLFTWADDCPHRNPDTDDGFDGVDDLIDEAMAAAHPAHRMTPTEWFTERKTIAATVALSVEYDRAIAEYEGSHGGGVCLVSPMGSACAGCTDGDDDHGYEAGPCTRQERARERQREFWWEFAGGHTA